MGIAYFFAALFAGRQDAILVYSPPLPLAATALVASRLKRAKCVANVQDLYPKTAIDLGLLRGTLAIRLARAMERWVYRHADAITVHSEGNREHVIAHGGNPERVHTIYNWVDLGGHLDGGSADRAMRAHFDPDAFIVFYGGAMGFAQALDEVLEAASLLREEHAIRFLFVGDGVMRERMERLAQERGLENVRFLRTVPPAEYEKLLASSDLALVTLRRELASPVVPGKLQSIMAAGRPVVVSTNPASDAKRFVEEAGCGLFAEAGDPSGLAAAIQRLAKATPEDRASMGAAGRAYAAERFDRRRNVKAYETLFTGLLGPRS